MRWRNVFLLIAAFAAGTVHAQLEMVGNMEKDLALLEGSLLPAISATGDANQDGARLAMEDLYRLWLTFRRMNIEGHPEDTQLAPDVEAIEARLWAASQLIDGGKLFDAHVELESARTLLFTLRVRYGLAPVPGVSARHSNQQRLGLCVRTSAALIA
jgi:hypothetical protein